MELEEFWTLIHDSSTAAKRRRERTRWLTENLARLPIPVIIEFELNLAAQRKRVDTRLMWGAAWNIMPGWCSGQPHRRSAYELDSQIADSP